MAVGRNRRILAEQGAKSTLALRTTIKHRYVVILDNGVNTSVKAVVMNLLNRELSGFGDLVQVAYLYEQIKAFAIDVPKGKPRLVIRALSRIPGVKYVERDRLLQIEDKQEAPPWGLDRIDQRTPVFDGYYDYTLGGRGVNVYLLDTGIMITHSDFTGRAFVAYDAVDDDDDVKTLSISDRKEGVDGIDCNGHGTHVAGIVGGKTYGVAKDVVLFGVRVIGRNDDDKIVGAGCAGFGRLSEILDGIDWVTANHRNMGKSSVVNLSIGGSYDIGFNLAVQRSIATGLIFVVAAGNDAEDLRKNSPASAEGVIPVGASEVRGNLDYRWKLSNYGPNIIFAPGVAIRSAGIHDDTDEQIKEGTSMAAPHVAGVVSQYLQAHPGSSSAIVIKAIKDNATVGRIVNPGPGSGNLLVYSGFR
jgi:subtilisin family serine protease